MEFNGSNGWDKYQLLVLSKLDELKSSIDQTNEYLWSHVKESDKKFENIRLDMATAKAVSEANAAGSAKFWSMLGGFVSIVLSILGDWILFGRSK